MTPVFRSLLLVVLAAGVIAAGAVALGLVGPAADGGDMRDDEFPPATATGTDDASTAGESTATAGTTTPVADPFAVTVDGVENCGTTCRDVTVSLTNRQADAATGVEMYTRVFAGDSTDGADLVWNGQESVGPLDASATHATTKRVDLSYAEALAVQDADGWVTVQTTVQSDGRTVTFAERRQVN